MKREFARNSSSGAKVFPLVFRLIGDFDFDDLKTSAEVETALNQTNGKVKARQIR